MSALALLYCLTAKGDNMSPTVPVIRAVLHEQQREQEPLPLHLGSINASTLMFHPGIDFSVKRTFEGKGRTAVLSRTAATPLTQREGPL